MKIVLSAVLAACGISVAGCAFAPSTGSKFGELAPPAPGEAAVYIYAPRTGMLMFGQMSAEIFVDEKPTVRIDEGLFFRVALLPGIHQLRASTDSQMACGGQLFPGTLHDPIVLKVSANQTYFVRYSSHPDVHKATTCDRYLRVIESSEYPADELKGLKEAAW